MSDDTERPTAFRLDRDTLVPVSVVIACIAGCVTGAMWVTTRMSEQDKNTAAALFDVNKQLADMRYEIQRLEGTLADRWTLTQHEAWALRFKLLNAQKYPDLRIPEDF